MTSLGEITQPIINNISGTTAGTLSLTSEIADMPVTGVALTTAITSATTIPNASFVKITFGSSPLNYYNLKTNSTTQLSGDFFIIKNVGALQGIVRLFNQPATGIINGITATTGSYMDFALLSGKKLVVYVLTTGTVSVTYL